MGLVGEGVGASVLEEGVCGVFDDELVDGCPVVGLVVEGVGASIVVLFPSAIKR